MGRVMSTLLAMALLVVASAGIALATADSGTRDPDVLFGTDGNNDISARAGRDYVDAKAGNDFVRGGDGGDELYGDSPDALDPTKLDGDDEVVGGDGRDLLMGFGGDDVLRGGNHGDDIDADEGDSNNPGTDTINGHAGQDTIYAQDGFKDIITCGDDADTVYLDPQLDEVGGDCETQLSEPEPDSALAAGA